MAAAVAVVWVLLAVLGARSARDDLRGAQATLREARRALGAGDLDRADGALTEASERLGDARATIGRPWIAIAGIVPTLGDDLDAVQLVTTVADDVVTTARRALTAARELTEADLANDGLPVATIEALGPHVRDAADAVERAVAQVTEIDPDGLLQEIAEGRQQVLDLLAPIADQLSGAADVVEQLPRFLGADERRRYFLAAANPAEARGLGGYLGSYTILTIDDGRLDFGTFQPLHDLDELRPGDIPVTTLAERYRPFGATWRWKNVNMSPDMPSVGRTVTTMWARQTGDLLDGVLLVDPFAIETMLRVTGSVETPGGRRLHPGTAVDYLTNEAYENYDEDQLLRKEELGEAAKIVLEAFLGRGSALFDHVGQLTRLLSEGQLRLYSTDPDIQMAFAAAGIDGALPDPDGDFLAVTANSGTNAKVDYFADRSISYQVQLHANFSASGDVLVEFTNDAPRAGQPRYVIGPNVEGLAPGQNRFYASTYCATSCSIVGAEGGLSGNSLVTRELGHAVAGTWVEVPAGATRSLRYQWRTEDAWRWEGRELVYRLLVRTQTAVRRPTLRVTVAVPEGFRFAGGSTGLELQGSQVRYEERPRGDVALEVRLLPDDDR